MLSNLAMRSVWSVDENTYMRCLWSAKWTNVHYSIFLCVCIHIGVHTHAHTSIMSFWSLQSNSFRQKSLKPPRFVGLMLSPSCLLNSHQPLRLPKITQERHSNPRLTTAQLGCKRRIKTHTKKETHHIVEGGKKSIHRAPCFKISTDDFGNQRTTHTNARGQDRGKESVFVCVCQCVHTFWMCC